MPSFSKLKGALRIMFPQGAYKVTIELSKYKHGNRLDKIPETEAALKLLMYNKDNNTLHCQLNQLPNNLSVALVQT